MNEELKLHIKKLQNRVLFSFVATLLTIISIGLGISLLLVKSFTAIIFFAIATISIVYLIYSSRIVKKETKETVCKPVVFSADKNFSFENIIETFEKLTDKDNQLSTSEDVRFFRFNKIFKLRVVLYRTADFNKKEFDKAKDWINKKANKALKISQWVSIDEARRMMRFNIVFTDILNNELYKFISRNTSHNLTRVEGVINIAIVRNQIIIPPIYGACDLKEISRYRGVIKFINQVLISN